MLDEPHDMPEMQTVRWQFNPTARLLLINVLALMGIGIIMIYSTSLSVNPDEKYVFFDKHLMFAPLAVLTLLVAMRLPYHKLNRAWVAIAAIGVSLALLELVRHFSKEANGAYRWFRFSLGGLELSFQPSELAKISLIVFFAWMLSRQRCRERPFLGLFVPLTAVLGLVCVFIAREDLGTALLVGAVGVGLMIVGGVKLRYMALLIPPAAAGVVHKIMTSSFRMDRMLAFQDPFADSQNTGYHIVQSLIAIGSGGWSGGGLGESMQKRDYLPEDSTDFIFSIICEEMGAIGGILVIVMFMTLALLGLRAAARSGDRFGMLLATGITLWVSIQAIINIGVATAVLPTKGIALPLISYGGTGMVLTAAALGLLIAIAGRSAALNTGTLRGDLVTQLPSMAN